MRSSKWTISYDRNRTQFTDGDYSQRRVNKLDMRWPITILRSIVFLDSPKRNLTKSSCSCPHGTTIVDLIVSLAIDRLTFFLVLLILLLFFFFERLHCCTSYWHHDDCCHVILCRWWAVKQRWLCRFTSPVEFKVVRASFDLQSRIIDRRMWGGISTDQVEFRSRSHRCWECTNRRCRSSTCNSVAALLCIPHR